MTFEEMFAEVKKRISGADVSAINEHLAYQFNITGDGAGSFYVEVRNGQVIQVFADLLFVHIALRQVFFNTLVSGGYKKQNVKSY